MVLSLFDEYEEDDEEEERPLFPVERPRGSMSRLVLPEGVRAQVEQALALLEHQQTLFQSWGLKRIDPRGGRVAIGLHGPPGTGKTLLAEALARRLGMKILRVCYAELESKWIGETEQHIVEVFDTAAEEEAVLFFDEADAVLRRRGAGAAGESWHAQPRAVMLTEIERFDGVVIFATNRPEAYDPAFLRRIHTHIELPLPDLPCRRRLWRLMMPGRLPVMPDVDLEVLARASDGLSGADIRDAVLAAAAQAVLRRGRARRVSLADLREAIRWRQVREEELGAAGSLG